MYHTITNDESVFSGSADLTARLVIFHQGFYTTVVKL